MSFQLIAPLLEREGFIELGVKLQRLRRDNQDATGATIRMRARRRWRTEGRA